MTYRVNAATKQKHDKGGEDESEIQTAMRRSVNSSWKQVAITKFSQNKHEVCKKINL